MEEIIRIYYKSRYLSLASYANEVIEQNKTISEPKEKDWGDLIKKSIVYTFSSSI